MRGAVEGPEWRPVAGRRYDAATPPHHFETALPGWEARLARVDATDSRGVPCDVTVEVRRRARWPGEEEAATAGEGGIGKKPKSAAKMG